MEHSDNPETAIENWDNLQNERVIHAGNQREGESKEHSRESQGNLKNRRRKNPQNYRESARVKGSRKQGES